MIYIAIHIGSGLAQGTTKRPAPPPGHDEASLFLPFLVSFLAAVALIVLILLLLRYRRYLEDRKSISTPCASNNVVIMPKSADQRTLPNAQQAPDILGARQPVDELPWPTQNAVV